MLQTIDPALKPLIERIQTVPDSERHNASPDEVSLVAQILIQQLLLSHPLLNEKIQEILDDFHFSN